MDRIGITAYINDFYSKLLSEHKPKDYRDYAQGKMRRIARENGLVIKPSEFKDSDRPAKERGQEDSHKSNETE